LSRGFSGSDRKSFVFLEIFDVIGPLERARKKSSLTSQSTRFRSLQEMIRQWLIQDRDNRKYYEVRLAGRELALGSSTRGRVRDQLSARAGAWPDAPAARCDRPPGETLPGEVIAQYA